MLQFSQNHTYLPDRFKSNFLCFLVGSFPFPRAPQNSLLSHNAVLAFWCIYNRNRKNTVEIRWVKSVDYVRIYNAINSEQAAAKADLYPLPVVLLASPAREPCFWLLLTVPIAMTDGWWPMADGWWTNVDCHLLNHCNHSTPSQHILWDPN